MTPVEWIKEYERERERERRRRRLHKFSNQKGSLCSMIRNSLKLMLRNFPLGWKGYLSFMSSNIGSILRFPTYYIPCIYLKKNHLLYRGTYHQNKVTHWLLGEILFLQKVKRNIGQEKKVEDRLVPLGLSIKVMSHGYWIKLIFLWQRKLYWVWMFLVYMCLHYDTTSPWKNICWGKITWTFEPYKSMYVKNMILLFVL